jgi:hypothetical protein
MTIVLIEEAIERSFYRLVFVDEGLVLLPYGFFLMERGFF